MTVQIITFFTFILGSLFFLNDHPTPAGVCFLSGSVLGLLNSIGTYVQAHNPGGSKREAAPPVPQDHPSSGGGVDS